MIQPLLTTRDMVTVVLTLGIGWSATACLAILAGDWLLSRRRPGPVVDDDLPTLISPRAVARRAGEAGAARLAGPGGAPDTVPTVLPDADTARIPPVPSTEQLPPLVVDSPPSMRGTQPAVLGVPVVRIHSCSLCRDGEDVIGDQCVLCGTRCERCAS